MLNLSSFKFQTIFVSRSTYFLNYIHAKFIEMMWAVVDEVLLKLGTYAKTLFSSTLLAHWLA